jgi:hypothetical protein
MWGRFVVLGNARSLMSKHKVLCGLMEGAWWKVRGGKEDTDRRTRELLVSNS